MTSDAVLDRNPDTKIWDIQIDQDGDIQTDEFFDTALLYSLFGERRAAPDEVVQPERRRGWIGNSADFENGSKIWLFEQSRLTRTNLNRIQDEAAKSLQWLVDDGYAVSIDPPVATVQNNGVVLTITIRRSRDQVARRNYTLWQNSGVTNAT